MFRLYDNVVIKQFDIKTNSVVSYTQSNKILPHMVVYLLSELFNFSSLTASFTVNPSLGITNRIVPNVAFGVQFGASGITIDANNNIIYDIVHPYPSLTVWDNHMEKPLLLRRMSNSVVSYPNVTDSIQYKLVSEIVSITVGDYPFSNGVRIHFSLDEEDMDPYAVNTGNNADVIYINENNEKFTVFSEVSLVLLPTAMLSSTSAFGSPTYATQHRLLANVMMPHPMLKNPTVIYEFTWSIWFNY